MMIQDIYRSEPWKLAVCCIMLNQTTGVQVKKVMRMFFKKYPTLDSLKQADEDVVATILSTLGLQNVKAKRIIEFAQAVDNEKDLENCNIKAYPNMGDYAEESFDVFVKRKVRQVNDREITKYLEAASPFSQLKEKIASDLDLIGFSQPIKKYATREILNYTYSLDSGIFLDVTDDRKKYVDEKLRTYKAQLDHVNYRLRWNVWNRQSVILFDQSEPMPNCTVSIQFQIRNETVYLSVFQRSQDIEKLEMDCEIFAKMALEVVKQHEGVDHYHIQVFVGNMHRYLR